MNNIQKLENIFSFFLRRGGVRRLESQKQSCKEGNTGREKRTPSHGTSSRATPRNLILERANRAFDTLSEHSEGGKGA